MVAPAVEHSLATVLDLKYIYPVGFGITPEMSDFTESDNYLMRKYGNNMVITLGQFYSYLFINMI